MKLKLAAALATLALSLLARGARADDTTLALTYSAPDGCPSEAQFQDEVAARLGRIPFAEGGKSLVVTLVAEPAGGWLGTLELEGAERVIHQTDCHALASDLSAIVAVQLEPPAPAPAPDGAVVGGIIGMARAPDTVTVKVTSEQPNLTLHAVRTQQFAFGLGNGYASTAAVHQFERLCTVPCDLELARADHHFAIGESSGVTHLLPTGVRIAAPSRLDIGYKSRARVRFWGGITMLVGMLVGGGVAFYGALKEANTPDPSVDMSLVAWGSSIAGASLVAGIVMACMRDKAKLELTPLH